MRSCAFALLALACTSTSSPTVAQLCDPHRAGSPELLDATRPVPVYPPEAREAGIRGWVALEGTVGSDGRVVDARVIRAEPSGVFDQAALDAFRQWRYCPGPESAPARVVGTKIHFDAAQ